MGATSGIPEASSRISFWRAAACRWLDEGSLGCIRSSRYCAGSMQRCAGEMCSECMSSRGERTLLGAYNLCTVHATYFVMGSQAGFGQKKEIPSDTKMATNYCGVVKPNLTRSPLRCRSDGSRGRAKLQHDSLTAGTRFLREERLIGGWRAACFIGWLKWPAWLAAGLLHPRNHETSKMRSLSGTARRYGTGPRQWKGHENPGQ